jgi:hypothetical protein
MSGQVQQSGADASVYRRVTCLEAFELLGAKVSKRGVAEADALVRTGEVRHKRYRVRRATNGQTTYRWGRLSGAEVIRHGDDSDDYIVVFLPDYSALSSSHSGDSK